MSLVSQIAGMTVLPSIPGSISPLETMFCSQDSLRFGRRFGHCKCAFGPECRLVCMRPCGVENVVTRQAQSHSVITIIGFCPTPSSVFDTRLYSVTGSGHIRRPAALGLLLRFAPARVSVPPKTNSLQERHRTPSEFLSVPSEKADLRHLGAGPTPAASPYMPRVNSGVQNGETDMYLNRITLIGFLGSNSEVRTVNNSTFTLLSLATKSSYKDKTTGEYVSHTEWHRAIAWGKLADYP